MKFKLDENFGAHTQELFRAAGYEVNTVRDEGLQGSSDQNLFDACCNEKHCLVTLDSDFSNPIHFPPDQLSGIVVIRVPQNPSLELLSHNQESSDNRWRIDGNRSYYTLVITEEEHLRRIHGNMFLIK
jgi:predicted nuclease of predicted toxin-antitoxin system